MGREKSGKIMATSKYTYDEQLYRYQWKQMANDQAQIDYFPPNHLFAIYEKSLIDRYLFSDGVINFSLQ